MSWRHVPMEMVMCAAVVAGGIVALVATVVERENGAAAALRRRGVEEAESLATLHAAVLAASQRDAGPTQTLGSAVFEPPRASEGVMPGEWSC